VTDSPNRLNPELGMERFNRTTLPDNLALDPARLYDQMVFASLSGLGLAYHYAGTHTSAAMPVWDNGLSTIPHRHMLKMLTAGNYKPVKEATPDEKYVRVCAEQNLFDNALREGDTHMGVLAIRGPEKFDDMEGTSKWALEKAFCMCGPCRDRTARILGVGFLVINFRGNSLEAIDVRSVEQDIQRESQGVDISPLAEGDEVKEFVVEAIMRPNAESALLKNKPLTPQRMYKRPS